MRRLISIIRSVADLKFAVTGRSRDLVALDWIGTLVRLRKKGFPLHSVATDILYKRDGVWSLELAFRVQVSYKIDKLNWAFLASNFQ